MRNCKITSCVATDHYIQLKCDEAVPACTNCLQRGWQCPGYGKHIRWSTKHERFGSTVVAAAQVTPIGGTSTKQSPRRPLEHSPATQAPDTQSQFPAAIPTFCTDPSLLGGDVAKPSDFFESASGGFNNTITVLDESAFEYGTPSASFAAEYNNMFDGNVMESRQTHQRYNYIDTRSEATWDPAHLAAPSLPNTTAPCFDPAMYYTPTHLPTVMIEFWFSDVCPMWCIFDSDFNYNRRFATKSWASSEPVFFAMQSMSAACMLDTLPTLTPVLSALTTKALATIRSRVLSFWATPQITTLTFPAELLFAIFAMGTSLHWKFGYGLGGELIKDAQHLIGYYNGKLPAMSKSDREHLAYFQKALICWEGLLCAADRDFVPAPLITRRTAHIAKIRTDLNEVVPPELQFGPPGLPLNDLELHPWCGVSSEVLQKFGQVMSLCHLARRRQRSSAQDLEIELHCDVGIARELASELTMMDFDVGSHWIYASTNDSDTPITHLLDIAETYRQACFLQLCLTFDDISIDATVYPGLGLALSTNGHLGGQLPMTRIQGLVGLSLRLVEQLKKIPPESGSRCMQPVLYLCVACGLQIDSPPQFGYQNNEGGYKQESNIDTTFTLSTLKVTQARSFVKKRLGLLQQLLPPNYTGTALKLAEAIWAEYDCTKGGGSPLYWFDVMVRERLQTFFG